MRVKSIVAGLAFACSLLSATQATAQDDAALLRDGLFTRDRNIAVEERPKPEYDPPPIRAGIFVISPAITSRLEWNSNVFAAKADQASDEIAHIEPAVSVLSDWSRNQVSAFARLDRSVYVDHAGEDATDYAAGAAGRLEARHDLGFAGGASFERDTEPRTDEASPPLSAHPVQYDVTKAWIEGTQESDRLRLTARGSIDNFDYDNASTLAGAQIYQEDQDHTTLTGAFRAEYAYLPEVSVLTSLNVNKRDYRNERPGEIARTSSGYETTLGASVDLTHLVRGEVFVGYLEQAYTEDSRFKSVCGLALRGQVDYFPTPITTITLSGSRDVEDSGIVDVDGFLASKVSLRLDHELLRNLILTGALSHAENQYLHYGRHDKINSAEFGANYLFDRSISLNFTYAHLQQDSEGADAGATYTVERAVISLTYRV